jgi:hypothetical protein
LDSTTARTGLSGDRSVVGKVEPDLLLGDLRVVDGDSGLLREEVVGDGDGGGLSGVSSVLLEGPSEDGNLLSGDSVEQGVDDLSGESVLLVLVHLNNSPPVLGDLGEVKGLGKVDQVEDILLEARSTETLDISEASSHGRSTHDRSLEELGSHSGVLSDGVGDLVDRGTGGLADRER